METSESINELAAALAKAQAEISNAKINKENPHFKSRYADLASVRDATVPALSKHGLCVVQTVNNLEKPSLFTRIVHASGQWVQSTYPLPNNFDKPQAFGSALTYARRYSLAAIVGISADEDDDANEAQAESPKRPPPRVEVEAQKRRAARSSGNGSPPVVEIAALKAAFASAKNMAELDRLAADLGTQFPEGHADRAAALAAYTERKDSLS